MVKVNMAGVSSGFEPLPSGAYHFAVTNVEMKKTQQTQKDMITAELTVQEGELTGRKIWDNFVIDPKSLFRLKMFMEAYTGEKIPEEEMDVNPEEFLGQEVLGIVAVVDGQGAYAGQKQNQIKQYKPWIPGASEVGEAGGTTRRRR
jgi:hypothetical protein